MCAGVQLSHVMYMSKKRISNDVNNANPNGNVIYLLKTYDIQSLEGKMLTFIEASVSDPEQRRATKDIIRQMIWDWAIHSNQADWHEIYENIGVTGSVGSGVI